MDNLKIVTSFPLLDELKMDELKIVKGGFPGVLWQAAKTNPQAAKTNPQAAKSIHRRQKQLAAP